MILRYKIWFSVMAIYEICAVTMLHFQRICDAMFSTGFCDTWYRYFLFCVAVPLVVYIIGIWIRQIFIVRHRHYLAHRIKDSVKNIADAIRQQATEHISVADVEKLIATAVLLGIKRYTDRHPDVRLSLEDAFGYSAYDTEPVRGTRTTTRQNKTASSAKAKKKK